MPTVQIEGVGRVKFPDEMTPEQITAAIETEILQQPRTTTQELGRQVGLTARHAIEGAAQVVTIPANALSSLVGLATGERGVDYDQKLSALLSDIGLPQPETATERVVGDASRAVASAGGLIGAAKAVPGAISQTIQSLPGRQAIGAAGGAGSAGVAREQGGGPVAQLAAGVAGGIAAPMAVDAGQSLVRGTGRFVGGLARTMTRSGQERIAGNVLREQATDPVRAQVNLAASDEIIPGSTPTSGAASKDIGLLALEKGLRSRAPARFGNRLSEQNLARQSILDEIAGTKADIAAAQAARNAETTPMREAAFRNARGASQVSPERAIYAASTQQELDGIAQKLNLFGDDPTDELRALESAYIRRSKDLKASPGQVSSAPEVDVSPNKLVTEHIDKVLSSPVGKRDVPAAALKWLKGKLSSATSAEDLYEIRKDIGDAMGGKLGGDESKFKLARKELMQVQAILDDAIEAVAPGFKAYLQRYKELSKPINQMEVLQQIRQRAVLAAPDVSTGREFLSQAKFKNAINLAAQKGKLQSLTADQLKTLNAVATDLDLGAAFTSSSVRAPGSDTFQNLSVAQAIGAATRGRGQVPQWVQPIIRPFNWALRGSDDRVNELLVDAMLDPKLAAQMLARATPKNARIASATMRQRMNAIARGGTLGTSQAASIAPQDRPEE